MRKIGVLLVLVTLMMPSLWAQKENWEVISRKTRDRIVEVANSTRGVVGVVVFDLTSGERFSFQDDFVFPQGSAIKIPILMEVYKQAGEGRFELIDKLEVGRAQQVGGSGVLKELGDGTSELSIRDLCVLMVLVSDNTATNILIDLVGIENVNRTLQLLGFERTRLRRRMIDQAASARGDENTSTPAEAARIMELLYQGEFLGRRRHPLDSSKAQAWSNQCGSSRECPCCLQARWNRGRFDGVGDRRTAGTTLYCGRDGEFWPGQRSVRTDGRDLPHRLRLLQPHRPRHPLRDLRQPTGTLDIGNSRL